MAKKYSIKNKEFLEILKKDLGIDISSHLSNLEEEQVQKIDNYFSKINMPTSAPDITAKQYKDKKERKEEKPLRKHIEEDDDEIIDKKLNNNNKNKNNNNKKTKNKDFDHDENSFKNKKHKKKRVEEQTL